MLKQSKKPPAMHCFMSEQEEAAWQEFWTCADELAAVLDEHPYTLADWARSTRLNYLRWRLSVGIKKLNAAFGRG